MILTTQYQSDKLKWFYCLSFQLLVNLYLCHCVVSTQLPGCHHRHLPRQFSTRTRHSSTGISNYCSSDFERYAQCPVRQNYVNLAMNGRSTCPWELCINTDPLRIPRDIFEAVCICTECIGISECSGRGVSSNYECQPMYRTIQVQRITGCNETGAYIYTRSLENVAVSCTCARKRMWRKSNCHRLLKICACFGLCEEII